MKKKIGIGMLGLGTVGKGVANIINSPEGRNPLISQLQLIRVAVRDINKNRDLIIDSSLLTQDPQEVIKDPKVDIVVEVMGGIEPARELILKSIELGKSVVTANKAVIARYGEEIANAAKNAGVYVLIEAAVGGGIPIIEPLKQSLGGNKINKITGIINGTTNYILTRMTKEGESYPDLLNQAQSMGYAESDPTADVEGLDAADKIAILSSLAFGGSINRENIQTEGISKLQNIDVEYAKKLGYEIKLVGIAEKAENTSTNSSLPLSIRVGPTLLPEEHPLAGVNGVNNAILIEGDPVGQVMFYGPGAGAGPTSSAVIADILNIAGIQLMGGESIPLDPLLSGSTWRECHLVKPREILQKNYIRLITTDSAGVIGKIGKIFGDQDVSIESIVQFDATRNGAEIVVVTHEVSKGKIYDALSRIESLKEVKRVAAHLGCL